MNSRKDLTGQVFGHWTVLGFSHAEKSRHMWLCECVCKVKKTVYGSNLTSKSSISCGCRKREDLTGHVFGRWTVLCFSHLSKTNSAYWTCQCSCGVIKSRRAGHLVSGMSQSCGCLRTEQKTKHSMCATSEYSTWEAIKHRCLNKNDVNYRHYGGRGIKVCDRWMDFVGFYEDMGKRPTKNHSIDRINNDGNYEKDNCRWATQKEQMSNTSRNAFIEWEGKKVRRLELVKRYNLTTDALRKRLSDGWSIEEALLTPVKVNHG